jgi:hypothetical protein
LHPAEGICSDRDLQGEAGLEGATGPVKVHVADIVGKWNFGPHEAFETFVDDSDEHDQLQIRCGRAGDQWLLLSFFTSANHRPN